MPSSCYYSSERHSPSPKRVRAHRWLGLTNSQTSIEYWKYCLSVVFEIPALRELLVGRLLFFFNRRSWVQNMWRTNEAYEWTSVLYRKQVGSFSSRPRAIFPVFDAGIFAWSSRVTFFLSVPCHRLREKKVSCWCTFPSTELFSTPDDGRRIVRSKQVSYEFFLKTNECRHHETGDPTRISMSHVDRDVRG